MKQNKTSWYKIMNIFFLLAAVCFLCGVLRECMKSEWKTAVEGGQLMLGIFLCFVCFLVLQLAKCLRFYLVLMEQRIQFGKFVRIYLKTTFVNFLLPMKSGELYRIYCFAHETNNVSMGFASVILDRILDTCVLLVFLVPYDFFVAHEVSAVTIILALIVFVAAAGCVFLYSSYGYLNRFLMIHGTSKRTIYLLQLLENLKMCYDYMAGLLKGRFMLILTFSGIGWIFEFLFLEIMAGIFSIEFQAAQFAEYIGGIFSSDTGMLKNGYVAISALGLLLAILLVFVEKRRRSGKC